MLTHTHHISGSKVSHHTSWQRQTLHLPSTQWMPCITVHSYLEVCVCVCTHPLISESNSQSERKILCSPSAVLVRPSLTLPGLIGGANLTCFWLRSMYFCCKPRLKISFQFIMENASWEKCVVRVCLWSALLLAISHRPDGRPLWRWRRII